MQRSQSGISKASLISPTPSIEADDEDSSLEYWRPDMESQAPAPGSHDPQYEDEDSRLTSRKELAGWYSYGWAAEVFAICAMGKAAGPLQTCTILLIFLSFLLTNHSRTTCARPRSAASRPNATMCLKLEHYLCCQGYKRYHHPCQFVISRSRRTTSLRGTYPGHGD